MPTPASRRAAYALAGELLRRGHFFGRSLATGGQTGRKTLFDFPGQERRLRAAVRTGEKAAEQVARLEKAGHFVQEEAPDHLIRGSPPGFFSAEPERH
ncbi:MAG: hypothetical protein IPH12_13820 [Saprospirales bacterium]|nr:hypothetical protein [Saprospirales bacterium]MBK8922813.1 hypothetical protein [Saprospirales bacterium]